VADSDDWEALVNALNLSGMLQQLAANCALGQRDGNNFQLTMSPNHKYLLNKSREDGLAQALSQYLGQPVTVNISLAGATTATPAERQQERADARQSQAEAVINSDDTVQAIMDAFDGQLKPGSVQPID
jgi:DNA polymerase-3 subunit gamma/tau